MKVDMNRLAERLLLPLRLALMLAAVGFIAVYIFIAISHLAYPYELEWMEGGIADHVARLAEGQPLYVKPSLDFIPYTYTPLYYYACLPAVKFFGLSFMPLRLVSLLASLGCLLMLFGYVRRETKSATAGLLAAGLFAAAYRACGDWYDMARPDSLFLLLLLMAIYLLRFYRGYIGLAVAGILLLLSFLTKQTALFVGTGLCVYTLISFKGLKRLILPTIFFGGIVVTTMVADRLTDGWYYYYIFGLPAHHAIVLYRVVSYWLFDLGAFVALALGFAGFRLLWLARDEHWDDLFFYVVLFGALLGAGWLVRMRAGSYTNTLIPAYTAAALGFGLGYDALVRLARRSGATAGEWAPWGRLVIPLLALAQFLALIYEPQAQLPSGADRQAGDQLMALLRDTEGEVFLPGHGFIARLAGKRSYAHRVAIRDVLRDENSPVTAEFRQSFEHDLAGGRFAMVILDDPHWFSKELQSAYRCDGPVFARKDLFLPVSGRPVRPELIYRRR